MKNIFIFWSFLWISISTATEIEHYWKDFHGYIPHDAFVGYSDINPIYIGKGYFEGAGILPATIYENSATITVTERGNNPVISENIMILCTQNPEALQWIPINYNDANMIQKAKLLNCVEGGTESSAPVYIGRHHHEGIMQIGKVYNVSPYDGLNIPNKKGGGTNYKEFDILVYSSRGSSSMVLQELQK